MDTSQRAAVSETLGLDLFTITNDTPETVVDSAFSKLQTQIKEEIEKNHEDGLNFLKSGRFLRLKMERILLWTLDKIIREGRIPNLDYDAISKYYGIEVEGKQTTRNCTFLRTKYLAFEAPIDSLQTRLESLTRGLMKVINPKTRQPKRTPSKVNPGFGKGKMPTVYIEDSNSSIFLSWRTTIKLEDTVYAEIEKITDPELLSSRVQLCLEAAKTYLKEKSSKLALFGSLTAAFFHQFKLMRISDRFDGNLEEKRDPETLEYLSFRLANDNLTSEQVTTYINLLSKKPRENLSSKVLSRQAFMTETEAKNLLKTDHLNCCLLDYLVYCVGKFGSAGNFSDKESLTQAVSVAFPQGLSKEGFRSLSYYAYDFKASELDSVWRSILGRRELKSQDFNSTLAEVKKLLDLLAEAKRTNPWLALVAFTEGDEFKLWGESCKKKLKVRIGGKKKAEIKLSNVSLKKGQLIKRVVAHLAQSVDISQAGVISFLVGLSEITKVPKDWIYGVAWRRHFQNLGSGFRVAILAGYFDGEDFESRPEVIFIREVCTPPRRKKTTIQKLSFHLLQDLAQHGDINKTKLLYNRLKNPFFGNMYTEGSFSRSLIMVYMRLMVVALDEGARLHSELAAYTGDKRQFFVDFLFLNHLRSLEYSDKSKSKQDLRGIAISKFNDINPCDMLSLMAETTESGKSPLYDYDWKEEFSQRLKKPQLFPLQCETPVDIAGGLAKFAILMRVMEITFGFTEEELIEIASKYATTFKTINFKTANLAEYVFGTAEGCFQNTDILGSVYLPFMRGAMKSLTPVKIVKGYLQFLVKFYEDPEAGNGVDEDFIAKVVEELRVECRNEELSEQYVDAVLENLPIDHRLIDSGRLKNLRILSNSSTIKDITRTKGEIPKKPRVTCEELKQLKKDNSLGSALTKCSSEVLKEYAVFCCETEDMLGFNALFGCIIQKRLSKVLQFLLERMKAKDHQKQNLLSKILYSPIYPFFSSNEQGQEATTEAKVSSNRNLVNDFYPSFSILLTELSVQRLGTTVSKSAPALSRLPLIVIHSPSSSPDLSTLKENCEEYHSGPNQSELIRSGFISALADVLPYLIDAVDPWNAVETSILRHSTETQHKLVAGLIRKPDMDHIPVRCIHGVSVQGDKYSSIAALKELSTLSKKKASIQLTKLFTKISVNLRRILIDEIVKKDLLIFALPIIVFLKPFLNDLKQLSNSITNFEEIYQVLKQMAAPANGTQAGYYVLNHNNKFIYRPFFYGDKPTSSMDNNMLVPLVVRAGLALYLFGADGGNGRETHEDFLKFIDKLLDHSKEARKGVEMFFNEINQMTLIDSRNQQWTANFSAIQSLFTKVFSFGTNLDRSSVPNFKFLIDFNISSFSPLKNYFFTEQKVKFSEKLMAGIRQREQADRENDGDILINFSIDAPKFVFDTLKLIEYDVADALDKVISCSSLKVPFPAIQSALKKRKRIVLPSQKVIFLQKGDPLVEENHKDVILIEVSSPLPGDSVVPIGCRFAFQEKMYSFPFPQRAPVKDSDSQKSANSDNEISFRDSEVKELVLSRITEPMRKLLGEELITSLFRSKSAEEVIEVKKRMDKKQKKFLNAFSGVNDWYLKRDLELCHLYFTIRDELKQHKANLDFSGFKEHEVTN